MSSCHLLEQCNGAYREYGAYRTNGECLTVSTHLLEEGAVALSHDGDGAPRPPRTRGAPHAMHVGLHLGGEIVVDDLVRVGVRVGVRVRVGVS